MPEIVVARESEIANGQMRAVQAGARRLVLFRSETGQFSILEDRCSHANVRLSAGKFRDAEVECVAHGARFDVRTGRALCMPAVAPVKSYPVKVLDGNVLVVVP